MVGRGRHPRHQGDDADGRPAVQVAGDGREGDLGPSPGVQPAADGDGRGGGRARDRAAGGELHGGKAGGDGGRAEDRGGDTGGSAGADRCAAEGDRLPPRRRPPGALGAEGTEAPAEAGGPPARTTSRDQTGEGPLEMVLMLVPFVRRHRRISQAPTDWFGYRVWTASSGAEYAPLDRRSLTDGGVHRRPRSPWAAGARKKGRPRLILAPTSSEGMNAV